MDAMIQESHKLLKEELNRTPTSVQFQGNRERYLVMNYVSLLFMALRKQVWLEQEEILGTFFEKASLKAVLWRQRGAAKTDFHVENFDLRPRPGISAHSLLMPLYNAECEP
jgi:hypothetical protein